MATCLILGRFSPEACGYPEEFEKLTDEQEEGEEEEDEEKEEQEEEEEEEEEEEDGEEDVSGNKAQAHIQGKPSSPKCCAVNFFLDFVPP